MYADENTRVESMTIDLHSVLMKAEWSNPHLFANVTGFWFSSIAGADFDCLSNAVEGILVVVIVIDIVERF